MFVFGVAVVLCVLASAHAQVMDIGACRNYQSSNSFTKKFIQKITESGEGYAVALSTESAIPCQQLRLFSNGTFVYSMGMADGNTRTFEGPFTAKTSSFNEAGYLDLDIPARVFGNGLLGNLRLYVLMTSDDYLVVAACWPLTVLRVENIYAMVPNSKFKINTATELNATLTKAGVPHTNRFHEVFQICNGTVPETAQMGYLQENRQSLGNFSLPINITFPEFLQNITFPNISGLVTTESKKGACKLTPFLVCRELLLLSDAVGLLITQTPFPICRPEYVDIFDVFCTNTFRSDLPFIRESDNPVRNPSNINFKLVSPTTSYSSYPQYYNPIPFTSYALSGFGETRFSGINSGLADQRYHNNLRQQLYKSSIQGRSVYHDSQSEDTIDNDTVY